ncbi:MAG: response regulator, partial [Muribaculaceae bacterium]|nr:response regulator [Muribaculaceae bacterium]
MRKDKVLLVEDDSTLAFIIADALRREGFDVVCAADGEAGLEAVAASLPDVVVADVMMPRMSGYEMVRRIRAANPSMPVLFLTARTSIDDLLKGYESGGNDYMRKPFQLAELNGRIKAGLLYTSPSPR